MKSVLAFLALVAFVAVGAYPSPTSPHHSKDKYGNVVTVTDQGKGASKETASSNNGQSQGTSVDKYGGSSSYSSSNSGATKTKDASAEHKKTYKSRDRYGNIITVTDQGQGASSESGNSGIYKNQNTNVASDGSSSSYSGSGNYASKTNDASAEHNKTYHSKDKYGNVVTVTDQGKGASKETGSSNNDQSQSTSVDKYGGSSSYSSSNSGASKTKDASAEHDKKYQSRDRYGNIVTVTDQGKGASSESGNSGTYKNQNTYVGPDGTSSSSSGSGNYASKNNDASAEHNKTYQTKDKHGNVVTVTDQGKGASSESGNSGTYKNQNTYLGPDGSSSSSSGSGNNANENKQASIDSKKSYQYKDKYGKIVTVVDKESGASKETGSSYNDQNQGTSVDKDGGSSSYSSSNSGASKTKDASAEHDKKYQSRDRYGNIVTVTDQGKGASSESGNSGTYKNQNTYVGPDGTSSSSSGSGNYASKNNDASAEHNKKYQTKDKHGNVVTVTDQGKGASSESGNSGTYKNQNTYVGPDGSSSSSSGSGNYANENKQASIDSKKSYQYKDKYGKIVAVVDKKSGASKETGSSYNDQNQGTSVDKDGGSSSYSSSNSGASKTKDASAEHDKKYQSRDQYGNIVTVTDQGKGASSESGNSGTYKNQNTYVGPDGTSSSSSGSGNYANENKQASIDGNKSYQYKDKYGKIVTVVDKESGASKETGSSYNDQNQGTSVDKDGGSSSYSSSNSGASKTKDASAEHDKKYQSRDQYGNIVTVTDQGKGASSESGNSGTYKNQNTYVGPDGTSSSSSGSGNYANENKQASIDSKKSYQYKDKYGKIVTVVDKESGASKETGSSYNDQNQGTSVDKDGGSSSYSSSNSGASKTKDASAEHDKKYQSRDQYGNIVTVTDQGKGASSESGNSGTYKNQNTYVGPDGTSSSSSGSGNFASKNNDASAEHNKTYQTKDKHGNVVTVTDQGKGASSESGNSGTYKNQNTYVGPDGTSSSSSGSGNYANENKQASIDSKKSYQYKDKYGKIVTVVDKESGASKETGSSYNDQNQGTSVDKDGGSSSYSSSNSGASKTKDASAEHDKKYQSRDQYGNIVTVTDQGKGASSESGNSGTYKNQNTYVGPDGTSSSSSGSGNYANENKQASIDSKKSYQYKDKYGKIVTVVDKESGASKETGSSYNDQNQGTSVDKDGGSSSYSSSNSGASKTKDASAEHDMKYQSRDQYGNIVTVTDQGKGASSESGNSGTYKNQNTYVGPDGTSSSSSGSGNFASKNNDASAEHNKTYQTKDKHGNVVIVTDQGKGASSESGNSGTYKNQNTYVGPDGTSSSSSGSGNYANENKQASIDSKKSYQYKDKYGKIVTVVNKESGASKETGSSYNDQNQGTSVDKDGGSSSYSSSNSGASKTKDASAEHVKKYQSRDQYGNIVTVTDQGKGASSESGNAGTYKNQNTYVGPDGTSSSSSGSGNYANENKQASIDSKKSYQYKDKYGKIVTVVDKESGASKETGSSYNDQNQGTSVDKDGGSSSYSSSNSGASKTKDASAEHDKKYQSRDQYGNIVTVTDQGKGASSESGNSETYKNQNTYVGSDGTSSSSSGSGNFASKNNDASAEHNKTYQTKDKHGNVVTVTDQGKGASSESGNSGTYKNQNTYVGPDGSSSSSSGSGNYANENKQASIDGNKSYQYKDKYGKIVTVVDKESGASKETGSSYNDQNQGTSVDKDGGSSSYSSSNSGASKTKDASAEHDKKYQSRDQYGNIVTVTDQGKGASSESGNSGTYKNQNTYVGPDGTSSSSSGSGNYANENKQASIDSKKSYQYKDKYGKIVTVVDKESGASKETGSSYNDQNQGTSVDKDGGSSSYSSSNSGASKTKDASAEHVKKYQSRDQYGNIVTVTDQGKGASSESGNSGTYKNQNTYVGPDGTSSSTSGSGNYANENKQASIDSKKSYQYKDKYGKIVTVVDKESGASKETGSSYNDQNQGTSVDKDGGSSSYSSSNSGASNTKDASAEHDKKYQSRDQYGNIVTVTDQGKGASSESGNSGTYKNQNTYVGPDGTSSSSSGSGNFASKNNDASAEHNKTYQTKDKHGNVVTVTDQGKGASSESGNSGTYKNQNTYVGPDGSSSSSSGSGNYANENKQASIDGNKSYQYKDKYGKIVTVVDKESGASKETGSSYNDQNQGTSVDKDGGSSSYSSSNSGASKTKDASAEHDKKYQSRDQYGNIVTVTDQGKGASSESGNSGTYKNQNTYVGPDGTSSSSSGSGNYANENKQASIDSKKSYQYKDKYGKIVTVVDKESGASKETGSSYNDQNQGTSVDKDGGSSSYSSSNSGASKTKDASAEHVKKYQSRDQYGNIVTVTDQGKGASSESGNSGTYKNQNTYVGPDGTSSSSSGSGNYANENKQASNESKKTYGSIDKYGRIVTSTDKQSGASKASADSGSYNYQNTNVDKNGGSNSSSGSGNYASANAAASNSYDKTAQIRDTHGNIIYSRDTGNAASESSGYSSNNESQGTQVNPNGSSSSWSSKSSDAVSHEAAYNNNKSVIIQDNAAEDDVADC